MEQHCYCDNIDVFLLHAMSSKIYKKHQFLIDGKNITGHEIWKLKEEIGMMKLRYNEKVEMMMVEQGNVHLIAFTGKTFQDIDKENEMQKLKNHYDLSDVKKSKLSYD